MDALRGLSRGPRASVAGSLRTRRHAPESPLTGTEFGPRAVLDPLDFELDVLVAERAVTANTLGHLHGGRTERHNREELLLKGSWDADSLRRIQFSPIRSPRDVDDFRTARDRFRRNPLIIVSSLLCRSVRPP